MRSMVIVIALPLAKLVVEQVYIVGNAVFVRKRLLHACMPLYRHPPVDAPTILSRRAQDKHEYPARFDWLRS
jgi:hypothetical protein